ncbi:MAG: hypothetical protein RIG61_12820 [Deltaproteobacteria bacterium]
MKSYYRTKRFVLIAALTYFVIGVALEFGYKYSSTYSKEIFPIYSWSLFAKTPSEVNDYSIRVISLRGQKLEEPFFLEESGGRLPQTGAGNAYRIVQVLGKAVVKGDKKKAADMILLLNTLYPGLMGDMNFEIVARKYNPLERLKFKEYKDIRVVSYIHNEGEAK